MILADKIIRLRQNTGWSQEELADRMHVSRQAVSRWELGVTLPDAPNLLKLSDLFGLSVDYLLRDDYEEEQELPSPKAESPEVPGKEQGKRKWYLVASGTPEEVAAVEGSYTGQYLKRYL